MTPLFTPQSDLRASEARIASIKACILEEEALRHKLEAEIAHFKLHESSAVSEAQTAKQELVRVRKAHIKSQDELAALQTDHDTALVSHQTTTEKLKK